MTKEAQNRNEQREQKGKGELTHPSLPSYPGKGEEQLPDREYRACRGKPEDTKRQRKGKGAAYNPKPKAYKGLGTQQLPTKELWCDNCWQRSHSAQACWWKGNNQQAQKHLKKQAWHRPGSKKQLERDIGDPTSAQWLASNKSLMSSFAAASSSTDLDEATRSTRQEAEQSSLTSPCHSALPQASGKENSSFVCLLCESVGSVSGGELLDNSLHPFQQPKSQKQQQLHNQHLRSTQLGSEKLEEAKGKGTSKKKSRSSEKTLEDVLSSACVYNLPDFVWHDPSSVFRGQPSRGQLSAEKLGIKTLTNKPAACKHKMLQESPGQSSAETPKTLPTVLSEGELTSFQGSQNSFRAMVVEQNLRQTEAYSTPILQEEFEKEAANSNLLKLNRENVGMPDQLQSFQLTPAQLCKEQLGETECSTRAIQLQSFQLTTCAALQRTAWKDRMLDESNPASELSAYTCAALQRTAWRDRMLDESNPASELSAYRGAALQTRAFREELSAYRCAAFRGLPQHG